MVPSAPFQTHANGFFIRSTTFSSTRKVGHQLTTAAAATTIVLVVARAIFMRRNPGTAKDGSVKVFVVARAIFERRKPKRHAAARQPGREPDPGQGPSPTHQHMRAATTRGLPPTAPIPTPPKVSSSTVSSSLFRGQEKSYAAAPGDPDASPPPHTPALR